MMKKQHQLYGGDCVYQVFMKKKQTLLRNTDKDCLAQEQQEMDMRPVEICTFVSKFECYLKVFILNLEIIWKFEILETRSYGM